MTTRYPVEAFDPAGQPDGYTPQVQGDKMVLAPPPGGRVSLDWFDVTAPAYGATGDGTTDDTAAVNAAIADLNTAGAGVLYFPAGAYKVTAGLTTITATARIVGDGAGDLVGQNATSKIVTASTTANVLTLAGDATVVEHLGFENTSAAETAGAAIRVTQGNVNRYQNLTVRGFYDCLNIEDGAVWSMHDCHLVGPVRYAVYSRHIDLVDGGDQAISNCTFYTEGRDASAAIRWESGGGMKVTNCKFNMDQAASKHYAHAIDAAFANLTTVDLLISNCCIENTSSSGVRVDHTGTGTFGLILITGCQFGFFQTGTAPAIELSNVYSVAMTGLVLHALQARTGPAVTLTNVTNAVIGDRVVDGFGSAYSTAGTSSNIVDGMAATSGVTIQDENGTVATGVTQLDFVGANVAAAAGTGEVVVTVTGSTSSGGSGELLMQDGVTGPPVPLETEGRDDWLYQG